MEAFHGREKRNSRTPEIVTSKFDPEVAMDT